MDARAGFKKKDPFYTCTCLGNNKYKDKDMIYNKAIEPSRLFGNVKTNGVATLANAHFPLINNVYDISADGLTIWAMTNFEMATHEISMDILVYNAQTNSECFMRDVRARLKTKKAIREQQSMRTVWHLKFEFSAMAASDRKSLAFFLENECQCLCPSYCLNTFPGFIR